MTEQPNLKDGKEWSKQKLFSLQNRTGSGMGVLSPIVSEIGGKLGVSDYEPNATDWRRKRIPGKRIVLIAVFLMWFSHPAIAAWWIVRSSDETCLVVDIEPQDKDGGVTKIGKDAYQTAEEAESDVKRLCR